MIVTQGDPLIVIDGNGGDLDFVNGQPKMSGGLDNAISISLFTKSGYWGNALDAGTPSEIPPSLDDEERKSITLASLDELNQNVRSSLDWLVQTGAVKSITSVVTNPTADNIKVMVEVTLLSDKTDIFFYEV